MIRFLHGKAANLTISIEGPQTLTLSPRFVTHRRVKIGCVGILIQRLLAEDQDVPVAGLITEKI